MNLGRAILKFLYPTLEAQRMECRKVLHELEANAEDIRRTLKKANGSFGSAVKHDNRAD